MPATLSHSLAPLATSGNRIVSLPAGAPVLLRGLNRSGLEYSPPEPPGSLERCGIAEEELEAITRGWGANVVRIPINQEWALARGRYDPAAYLAALDQVIEMAARRGAYTLVDLQWFDARTPRGADSQGNPNYVPPLPVASSLELWRQLAARYRDEPAVLYDVFNEPHDPLPGDPVPLEGIDGNGATFPLETRRVTMGEWQPWARALVGAIRGVHPAALIFVPGVNWAYDLEGMPIEGLEGVVYSTHVYRNKGSSRDEFRRAFGALAARAPVFAGEWGGTEQDLEWGREVADYFDEIGVGWTAWSWSDRPRLVEGPPLFPPYPPTAFGELVRARLASASPGV